MVVIFCCTLHTSHFIFNYFPYNYLFFLTGFFRLHNYYRKWYSSIENRILRAAQPIWGSAHLHGRISARNTENSWSNGILGWTSTFRPTTPVETSTIRRRIEFWIQHNPLESQHKSMGECQQDIPWKVRFGPSIWGKTSISSRTTGIELCTIRSRIEFYTQHNQEESQHRFVGECQ
jgi:hypothetical protein